MAVNYISQASKTLSPAYTQQANAIKSQIPAINTLYETLYQGLEGDRKVGTQNIFETTSGRGLLKSTIPVDLQTNLEQALLQKRTQLGSEQAEKISGVNTALGQLQVDRTSAISTLANTLRGLDLDRQKFSWQKRQGTLDLRLKKRIADREYQLRKELARMGIF